MNVSAELSTKSGVSSVSISVAPTGGVQAAQNGAIKEPCRKGRKRQNKKKAKVNGVSAASDST